MTENSAPMTAQAHLPTPSDDVGEARVISVNLGKLSALTIRGREVRSGIVKSPVSGPVQIHELGLSGDHRAEPRRFGERHHAVHFYPIEHFEYWKEHEGLLLQPGQLGENLTVSGLLESHVRIGDVLRAGSAVLQVSQHRIPCRKIDHRVGRKFSRRFLESWRVGYYLRVLEPGWVEAGDRIELLETSTASPTVEEFIRISHFDYWDREGLQYLLEAKDLMPAWREILEDKLKRAQVASGWFALRSLEVLQVDFHGELMRVTLRCARGKALPAVRVGAQLPLALGENAVHRVLEHAFMLCPDSEPTERYCLVAKVSGGKVSPTPHGYASSEFPGQLRPGQQVLAGTPRPGPELDPQRLDGALLLSDGIGLIGLHCVLRHAAAQQEMTLICEQTAESEARYCLGEEARSQLLGPLCEIPGLTIRQGSVPFDESWEQFTTIVAAGSEPFVDQVRRHLGPQDDRLRTMVFR